MSENGSDLESRHLNVLNKRYYFDVKENVRGRFIKIAEMGSNYKSRIVLSMIAAVQVRDQLTEMIKFSDSVPEGEEITAENGVLKSETLLFDSRRYYIDLKENKRGRFVRIAQTIANPRAARSQVAVPASGMVLIRDCLTELLEKYSEGFLTDPLQTTQKSKQVAAEGNKNFFFDLLQNDRGSYVRITEVKGPTGGFRTSITVPTSALEKFSEALDGVIEESKNAKKEVKDE